MKEKERRKRRKRGNGNAPLSDRIDDHGSPLALGPASAAIAEQLFLPRTRHYRELSLRLALRLLYDDPPRGLRRRGMLRRRFCQVFRGRGHVFCAWPGQDGKSCIMAERMATTSSKGPAKDSFPSMPANTSAHTCVGCGNGALPRITTRPPQPAAAWPDRRFSFTECRAMNVALNV